MGYGLVDPSPPEHLLTLPLLKYLHLLHDAEVVAGDGYGVNVGGDGGDDDVGDVKIWRHGGDELDDGDGRDADMLPRGEVV